MKNLPDITAQLLIKDGFCHPDWDGIELVIEKNLSQSDWNAAWEEASRKWLSSLQETLQGNYQIHETANFQILSDEPDRIMRGICKAYERSLQQILSNLSGVAIDEGYGKHVVLMFSDLDHYYGYICHFYPDGEHPMSGGTCINSGGFTHFVLPSFEYSEYTTSLVHELTHGCTAHLPLPIWLNEALAMRMEEAVCGSEVFHLDREVYERHGKHWSATTIQQFWTGESWNIPGESFDLSYNLAQVLWRKFEVDLSAPQEVILQFASKASWDDSGEAACKEVFDLSLGDFVSDFLGEGPWTPRPHAWPQ